MLRGEIWWASLPVPRGFEPGYRRPVVIVQSDAFNRSEISTIVVAAISSNLRLAEAPGNIFLKRRDSGLPKESVIDVSQLFTIDKKCLMQRVRELSPDRISELNDSLKIVLSI